ncbi:hypothetical protein [Haloarcula pellucida]|uniref:Uncharacterized protein n=1 Tax=Haloarcula pellucida TaxID=1427151 RepID=A0A830GKL4_9EURY|nr:hypothetical protein [Halomicroarcula pellucida]MBX0348690.1 hypothetical protein [Halomicroarcula pellucida]GGN92194.1 hypothetical protein GCM10009030_16190 [Halomicroarcula pellucida]
MPSTTQSGDRRERMRCPNLAERIGEDPARWLDADLLRNAGRKQLVFSLINGIDSLERVAAWHAVEMRLANDRYADEARNPLDEPRAAILQRLDQREEWLRLNGERPDRLPFGPRASCECCDADGFVTAADLRERDAEERARLSDGYSPDGVDTNKTTPETETATLGAYATDGGQDP